MFFYKRAFDSYIYVYTKTLMIQDSPTITLEDCLSIIICCASPSHFYKTVFIALTCVFGVGRGAANAPLMRAPQARFC